MTTTIHGLEEAVRKLKAIGAEGERIASKEIVASALDVQAEAKRILTRTKAVDTGRLRNSIAVGEFETEIIVNSETATGTEPGLKSGGSAGGAEAPNAIRAGMLNAVIGTNVHYAAAIHFGTRRVAPRPYLVPAVEMVRPKMLRRLEKSLKKLEDGQV